MYSPGLKTAHKRPKSASFDFHSPHTPLRFRLFSPSCSPFLFGILFAPGFLPLFPLLTVEMYSRGLKAARKEPKSASLDYQSPLRQPGCRCVMNELILFVFDMLLLSISQFCYVNANIVLIYKFFIPTYHYVESYRTRPQIQIRKKHLTIQLHMYIHLLEDIDADHSSLLFALNLNPPPPY